MNLGKEQIEGTVRKTYSEDEAKILTVKYFLQISERSKLLPPTTIQTTGAS